MNKLLVNCKEQINMQLNSSSQKLIKLNYLDLPLIELERSQFYKKKLYKKQLKQSSKRNLKYRLYNHKLNKLYLNSQLLTVQLKYSKMLIIHLKTEYHLQFISINMTQIQKLYSCLLLKQIHQLKQELYWWLKLKKVQVLHKKQVYPKY